MFSIIVIIIFICLIFPVVAAAWLIMDNRVTKLIKKELAKYDYKAISVNETKRKFAFFYQTKWWSRHIIIDKAGTSERTYFREVTFINSNKTVTCHAAVQIAWFSKPEIFFDIDLKTLN